MSKEDSVSERLNRLALLGTQSAVLMHELRQPFFCLRALADLALVHETNNGVARDMARSVAKYVDAMESIVARYEGLSRPVASSQDFDLNDPVGDAVLHMKHRAVAYGATLHEDLSRDPLWVTACPMMARQVAFNLIQNAYEAVKRCGSAGRVVVRTAASEKWVRLEVEDDGGGLSDQMQSEATEPFVTSRASDGGTGLGLYVVRSIVTEVNGTFSLEDGTRGVRAVVRLPKVA